MDSIQMKLLVAVVSPDCQAQLYATTGDSFPTKGFSLGADRKRFEDRLGLSY